MVTFTTDAEGRRVRVREATRDQVESGIEQVKADIAQWQDAEALQALTDAQRWALVRSSMLLVLRACLWLANRELRRG